MNKYKPSDLKPDYLINFLQEYSYYIKEYRNEPMVKQLMCPTEFFNSKYISILKETEKYQYAFIEPEDIKIVKKLIDAASLYNYVGEGDYDETFFEMLENLSYDNNYYAIIELVKKDVPILNLEKLLDYYLDISLKDLNDLADEAGYEGI